MPLGARRGQYRDLADFLQVEFGLPPTGIDEDAIVASGFRSKEDAIGPETPVEQLTAVVAGHATVILEASAKSRQTLRAYLSSLALSDANSALVDIGYAGQIQTTFSEVLETDLAGYYLATFSASKNDTKSLPMAGYLAQSAKVSDKAIGICRHRRLYETLLCAPGPSYIGLDRQPSGWVGLADITTETPVRDAFVAEAHRGAIAFVSDYAAGGDAKAAVAPTVATAFLDAALDRPTPELAAWLGELEFEDRLDRSKLRRLVSADPDAPSSLWREGQHALNIPERAGHDAASVAWAAFGPYGVLGWRHALTPIVARFIEKRGDVEDAQDFRDNPIRFFRRLSNQRYRKIGRILYPWD